MKFIDLVKGHDFEFTLVDRDKIINSPYQRVLSSALVKKLVNSVGEGFLVPVILVKDGKKFLVIDGQHRLAALDYVMKSNEFKVPAIVVPTHFRDLPLFYNIEKTDNIKDKCEKLYRLYTDKAQTELTEWDILASSNYEPYLFTLAFAYCESGLKSPSLVEPPIKKVDRGHITEVDGDGYHARLPLSVAIEVRRERGAMAAQLEQTVEEVCQNLSITDFNLKRAIVSKASQALWGMRRKVEEPFDEAIGMLMNQIVEMDWSWMEGQ
jgi:hypothetical protein